MALKFKKRKSFNYKKNILSILGRVNFPYFKDLDNSHANSEGTSYILNKYKDGKILSYINNHQNLDKFINEIHGATNQNIHKEIFNSIQYKNIEGIRIETNGRLTKRYRADRAVHYRKWKGGLQKTSLNSTLFRGNVNPNISYSIANDTRRVGSFAIRGWISGK
uniref:Ribosomal protein S3 n=1 Tax=Samsoniella hepiali TaxID=797268 RepID=A0A0U1WNU1_9HYPO|nr:ribosomal protein S3 [Samsoniella hepiali]